MRRGSTLILLVLTALFGLWPLQSARADWQEHLKQGVELINNYYLKDREALPHLEQAYKEAPDNVEVGYWYGRVLYQLKKYEEAMKVLDAVVEKDPSHVEANAHLAYTAGRLSQIKGNLALQMKAQKHLDAALKLDPNYAPGYLAYGIGYTFLKIYKQAQKMFEKAKELTPKDPWVWLEYGRFHLLNPDGDKEEAMKMFERAIKLAERAQRSGMKDPMVPKAISLYLEEQKYYKEALEYAKLALEWNPEDKYVFEHQGVRRQIERLNKILKTGEEIPIDITKEL